MSLFFIRAGRAIAMAAFIGAALTGLSVPDARADSTAKAMSSGKANPADAERKIKEIHDKLHITPAQEELWGNVAQTMRDNAKTFQASRADRIARGKTMNVVENLKFMQGMVDQHSSGLKQLIPQVEALYAVLTPEQKKQADQLLTKHQDGEYRGRYDRK